LPAPITGIGGTIRRIAQSEVATICESASSLRCGTTFSKNVERVAAKNIARSDAASELRGWRYLRFSFRLKPAPTDHVGHQMNLMFSVLFVSSGRRAGYLNF